MSQYAGKLSAAERVWEVASCTAYMQCQHAYVTYSACNFAHDDMRLASALSRGSLVSVEFKEDDGVHSLWFGIIRFFASFSIANNPPCFVAYIDYFHRWRPETASPVQRQPLTGELDNRVVQIDDIVGKVLLLPTEDKLLWYVVDGM